MADPYRLLRIGGGAGGASSGKIKDPLLKGPYSHKESLEPKTVDKKQGMNQFKLAGGNKVVTRDEDPRIDIVNWSADMIPKSYSNESKYYVPFQHETWTVKHKHLVKMLKEDIRENQPYIRLFPPSLDLKNGFQGYLGEQGAFYADRGVTPEDIKPFVPFVHCDPVTGSVTICVSENRKHVFPGNQLSLMKLDDEMVRKVSAPCGKVNFQDALHQAMKEDHMEKIKKYEEMEKLEELKRQRAPAFPVIPHYQPGVKGTPKVPRLEPTWLANRTSTTSVPQSTEQPSTSKPVYVWPSLPDEDDFVVSSKVKRLKKTHSGENSVSSKRSKPLTLPASSKKSHQPLLLKIRKNIQKNYESMFHNGATPQTTSRSKRKEVPKIIKPSITSISGPEEQEKLEKIKTSLEQKSEKKVAPPVVIEDPRIEIEKRKQIEKAKREQERLAKIAAARAMTEGAALPISCFGSLNPERMISNGEPYLSNSKSDQTYSYSRFNGNNGFHPAASSRPYKIPKRAAMTNTSAVLSMPDLLVNDEGYVETALSRIPKGSLNPVQIPSLNSVGVKNQDTVKVNGAFSSVSTDEVDNHPATSASSIKKPVFIPVASDEDCDDDDVLDIHADCNDDDFL